MIGAAFVDHFEIVEPLIRAHLPRNPEVSKEYSHKRDSQIVGLAEKVKWLKEAKILSEEQQILPKKLFFDFISV